MTTHVHIATGLQGYGPDSEDPATFELNDLEGQAEYIRSELSRSIDYLWDSYSALGESGQFEQAWNTHTLIQKLETVSANLSETRAYSPRYIGNPKRWAVTLQGLITDADYLDISENGRLYVWECTESECTDILTYWW